MDHMLSRFNVVQEWRALLARYGSMSGLIVFYQDYASLFNH